MAHYVSLTTVGVAIYFKVDYKAKASRYARRLGNKRAIPAFGTDWSSKETLPVQTIYGVVMLCPGPGGYYQGVK